MQIEAAVEWVDQKKEEIRKCAVRYIRYVPYDVDDYLQEAYVSATEAVMVVNNNPKLDFDGVFWKIFKRNVSRVTPWRMNERVDYNKRKLSNERYREAVRKNNAEMPKEYRLGRESTAVCVSLPSNMRGEDIPLELIRDEGLAEERRVDLEAAFECIKERLSPREAEVMQYALGITMSGTLTPNEIAAQMGVSRRTVRILKGRAMRKMESEAAMSARRGPDCGDNAAIFGIMCAAAEEEVDGRQQWVAEMPFGR